MPQAIRPVEAVARAASNELPESLRAQALEARLYDGIIRPPQSGGWTSSTGLSVGELLQALVPLAASMAHAPTSGFYVGAVVVAGGRAGSIYLGGNYEFEGAPLAASIHAEQAAVNRAWLDGATSIEAIATSATPCGHCRQFLAEVKTESDELRVLIPDTEHTLDALLPAAFAPAALGVQGRLLEGEPFSLVVPEGEGGDALTRHALEAASRSYVPYSDNAAGVALLLASGSVVTGRSCENAAFNPSLSPLQSALAVLGVPWAGARRVVDAVIVEEAGAVQHARCDQQLLETAAPGVALRRVVATRSS